MAEYGITCDTEGNRQVRAIIHNAPKPDKISEEALKALLRDAIKRFQQAKDSHV